MPRMYAEAENPAGYESRTLLPYKGERVRISSSTPGSGRTLPESKEGCKCILGLAHHFSAFVIAIAIKGKTHEEVMEAFINNCIYRIGPLEIPVSDNEFDSQEVHRICRAFNI